MNRIILALRARMGLEPTTEKALAGLTKALNDLRAVAQREADAIAAANAQIEALRERAAKAGERAVKADRIADRIEGLVA